MLLDGHARGGRLGESWVCVEGEWGTVGCRGATSGVSYVMAGVSS